MIEKLMAMFEEFAQQEEKKEKTMSNLAKVVTETAESKFTFNKDKLFLVPEGRYYDFSSFENEDEATEYAKKQSIQERKLIAVYKAIKSVSFPAPSESSLKVEKVA